jgi:nitrite reductase (NO-forming)
MLELITAICIVLFIYLLMAPTTMGQIRRIQLEQRMVIIVPGASDPAHGEFYSPQSIAINSGTIVKWRNDDNSLHTVTFVTPGIYDSGIISIHAMATPHTFFNTGVFNYFCRIHPFMTGTVKVV